MTLRTQTMQTVWVRLGRALALGALTAGTAGCPDEPLPASSIQSAVPVPGVALDRSVRQGSGLLGGIGPHGQPLRDHPDMDPLVAEARRFYDTVGRPGVEPWSALAPGAMTSFGKRTAPLTLEEWKQVFGFPERRAGEPLSEYRERANVVIYYNRNELGLGRELGCAEFIDGVDATNTPLMGVACYVTNYGEAFRDQHHALRSAIAGTRPRNTVCITYRPSMDEGYQVQFYTYDRDGQRVEWAQLDTLGARPHPHVCMNCHGGQYDEQRHLAKNARFLPMDPSLMVFSTRPDLPHVGRAAQEDRIRHNNTLALRTPLAPAQRALFAGLYGDRPDEKGRAAVSDWVPPAWQQSPGHRDLYTRVLKPYCLTCHLASSHAFDGSDMLMHRVFESPDRFSSFPMTATVCGSFSMPNAQPTSIEFWNVDRPVLIDGRPYPSAADAFLAWFGADRNTCAGLAEVGSCARGPDPDALCGDAFSGTACNRKTLGCVPAMGQHAPENPAASRGYCKTDGTRSCPTRLQCVPNAEIIEGLEAWDGMCVE